MRYYLSELKENFKDDAISYDFDAKQIVDFKKFIDHFSSIEQKYDVIIQNFIDFELKLYHYTISRKLSSVMIHQPREIELSPIRTSLFNLILSLGVFIEQINDRHLSKMALYGDDLRGLFQSFKSVMKECGEINFVLSLRDYAAHRDIPFHLITLSSKWDRSDIKENDRIGFCTIPQISTEKLLNDRKFKKSTINNITIDSKGYIDIRKVIRVSIRVLSELIDELRINSESLINSSKSAFEKCLSLVSKNIGSESYFCYITEENESQKNKVYFIDIKQLDTLHTYKMKNKKLINFDKWFFHNRI